MVRELTQEQAEAVDGKVYDKHGTTVFVQEDKNGKKFISNEVIDQCDHETATEVHNIIHNLPDGLPEILHEPIEYDPFTGERTN